MSLNQGWQPIAIPGVNPITSQMAAQSQNLLAADWATPREMGAQITGRRPAAPAPAPAQQQGYAEGIARLSTPAAGAGRQATGPLTSDEAELLAKTLQAEAGGESLEGILAAGSVIMNRVQDGGYGDGLRGVIMKPGQFSAWNGVTGYADGEGALDMDKMTPSEQVRHATNLLLSGQYRDPTGGATHYYNPSAADPVWGMSAGGDWKRIGNHVFGFADAGRA